MIRTFAALVAAALLWPPPAHAAGDLWLGPDKALHFGFSSLVASGTEDLSAVWLRSPEARAAVGGGVAFGVGAVKEIYDLSGRGDPSFKDLAWDALGSAAGAGIALLFDKLQRWHRHSTPAEGTP